MSGARKALRRDSNTGQASSPEGRSVSSRRSSASRRSAASARRPGGLVGRRPSAVGRRRRLAAFAASRPRCLGGGVLAPPPCHASRRPRRRRRRRPRRPRRRRGRGLGSSASRGFGVGLRPWPCRASVALASAVSGVTPSAASGEDGTSRTLTLPPAASILTRADAVNASATTKSGTVSSPAPRILSGLLRVRTSPTARRMSWLTVIGPPWPTSWCPRTRTRRDPRARRWPRCSRPRTRS